MNKRSRLHHSHCWFSDLSRLDIVDRGSDTIIAFDCLSGDTHILNFFSYAILKMLDHASLTVDEICQGLRINPEFLNEEIPTHLVGNTVMLLDDVGLIQPISDTEGAR